MKEERELMPQEEFEKYIGVGHPKLLDAVRKFRSIRRAIRRGHVSSLGEIYPKRPFNNRKTAPGGFNEYRKYIYERIKHRGV